LLAFQTATGDIIQKQDGPALPPGNIALIQGAFDAVLPLGERLQGGVQIILVKSTHAQDLAPGVLFGPADHRQA
jgi:hypothetical protein